MAVVTSAVVGAIGTAYSIGSAEEQKQKARLAGQKADREKNRMETEKQTKKARDKAVAAREAAVMQQQAGPADAAKDASLLGGGAPSPGKKVGKLGETQSGKTLLGV